MSALSPGSKPPEPQYQRAPTELKVLHSRPRTAVIEVLGEHDLATRDRAAALFTRLIGENDLTVIDITETQFIDSSFLNNLKNAQHAAQNLGHTVLLQVGTEPIVKRMLEITNFLKHFDYVTSREEALARAPGE